MGQAPWKARADEAVKKMTRPEQQPSIQSEAEATRAARLDRLQAEIEAGTYRISAETLAGRLVRRLRWW